MFDFFSEKSNPYAKVGYEYVKFYRIPYRLKITKIVMKDWFIDDVILPDTVLHFKMGSMFDRLIDLPESLIFFEMGMFFKRPITLPDTLQCLIMGLEYNNLIKLPDSLLYLTIGDGYNHPIILPKKLCYLEIQSINIQLYNIILPESLETIICNENNKLFHDVRKMGARWIDSIPNSVKTISFYGCNSNENILKLLPNIPNSVKYVLHHNVLKYDDTAKKYIFIRTNVHMLWGQKDGMQMCTLPNGEVMFKNMCMEINGIFY